MEFKIQGEENIFVKHVGFDYAICRKNIYLKYFLMGDWVSACLGKWSED